ncbi:MAG: tetratricopeptide repeat protein [Sandaracinaceae bacterium]
MIGAFSHLAAAVALALAIAPASAEAQPGRGVDRRGERVEQLLSRGEAHLTAGDRGSAIGYFRDAIAVDPTAPRPYLLLGRAYRERGSFADARAVLEAGLVRQPDAAELWLELARLLHDDGATDDAARALRSLLARHPDHPDGLRLAASYARERGAWNEALTAYRRLIARADALGIGGEELAEARRYEAALRVLARPLDPVGAPRSCAADASPIRRAVARCAR